MRGRNERGCFCTSSRKTKTLMFTLIPLCLNNGQQLGFTLKKLEETNSLDTHALETAWSYVCLDPDRTEKEPCQTRWAQGRSTSLIFEWPRRSEKRQEGKGEGTDLEVRGGASEGSIRGREAMAETSWVIYSFHWVEWSFSSSFLLRPSSSMPTL